MSTVVTQKIHGCSPSFLVSSFPCIYPLLSRSVLLLLPRMHARYSSALLDDHQIGWPLHAHACNKLLQQRGSGIQPQQHARAVRGVSRFDL